MCNLAFGHYLPQSYQRGWIDASGRPHVYRWAYNKLVCEPKATKSTGGRDGLYFIPMAPPDEQNTMEEAFWKKIDQWGADGLALLRTNDPSAAARINKDRLATFVMSFLFRNPNKVKYFNAWAKESVLNGCLKDDYAKYRKPHEPATFEDFKPHFNTIQDKAFRHQIVARRHTVLSTTFWAAGAVSRSAQPHQPRGCWAAKRCRAPGRRGRHRR